MRLLRYSLRLSRALTVGCIVAGLASGLAVSFVPFLIGGAVGGVVSTGALRLGDLGFLLAAFLVQGLARPLLWWLDTRLFGLTNRDQVVRLGSAGVASPSVTRVEDPAFRSAVSFAQSQLHFLDSALRFVWVDLFPGVTALVTLTVLAWVVFSPVAAGVLVGAVVFDAWWTGRVAAAESTGWGNVADESSRAEYAGDIMLNSGAAKEVRVFSLAPFVRGMYHRSIGQVHDSFRSERWSRFRGGAAVSLVRMAVIAGVVVWVTLDASSRTDSVGLLATALPVVIGFAAIDLAPIRLIGQGQAALALFEDTVSLPVQGVEELAWQWPGDVARSPSRSRPRRMAPPRIVFEDVSFRYATSSTAALSNLSFELRPGVAHALVGENGAGKSTIVKLMAGAYRPTTGRILVDGVDTATFTEAEWAGWQRQFASVLQDIPTLPIPIGDYVDLGASLTDREPGPAEPARETMTRDQASGRTGLLPVVQRLAAGWETPLSSTMAGGTDLSGGEWQRVALTQAVRAVDGGASVFVLDEPAAALDVESEAELVADYLRLVADTTSLVISHRFSVVRPVHHILVLGGGRIIESGSHEDLMRQQGRYAAMFAAQSSAYTDHEPTMGDE